MEDIKLVKFIGNSDCCFKFGSIYEIMKIVDNIDEIGFFEAYIKTANGIILHIPYSSINTFLENWEVIDE